MVLVATGCSNTWADGQYSPPHNLRGIVGWWPFALVFVSVVVLVVTLRNQDVRMAPAVKVSFHKLAEARRGLV